MKYLKRNVRPSQLKSLSIIGHSFGYEAAIREESTTVWKVQVRPIHPDLGRNWFNVRVINDLGSVNDAVFQEHLNERLR